ncbi:MAG TPA: nucleotide exchange factor GrpE [Flavobacteriaceae bacterium]|nr:nucleotide exchange factor GrpE [Flavobacteriaceae bacterium]
MSKDKNTKNEETLDEKDFVEKENTLEDTSKNEATADAENPETEELKEEISENEVLKEELNKERDRFVRLVAEFENYKRRTNREKVEMYATAGREVIESLLPIFDDFERALAEIEKSEDKEHFQGVELIYTKLAETLKKQGLEVMPVKEGDRFDADLHEAVTQIPAPKKKLKGKIVDVIQKGYTLGDRIIRYPKVVTGA